MSTEKISKYLVNAGFLKSCVFSLFYECDLPIRIAVFVLVLILLIPYYYILASLVRRSILADWKPVPGLFYLFTIAMAITLNLTFNYTYNYIYHGDDITLLTRLFTLPNDLVLMSKAFYFGNIANVLIAFRVPGSYIILYFAKIVIYTILALFLFRLGFLYVEKMPKFVLFMYAEWYFAGSYYIELIIDILSFIILSAGFIFSSVASFVPHKSRKPMKIALFFFPLTFFVYIIIKAIFTSIPFNEIKSYDVKKFINLSSIITIIRFFGTDYVILTIVAILAAIEYADDSQGEQQPDEVFETTFMSLNDV